MFLHSFSNTKGKPYYLQKIYLVFTGMQVQLPFRNSDRDQKSGTFTKFESTACVAWSPAALSAPQTALKAVPAAGVYAPRSSAQIAAGEFRGGHSADLPGEVSARCLESSLIGELIFLTVPQPPASFLLSFL